MLSLEEKIEQAKEKLASYELLQDIYSGRKSIQVTRDGEQMDIVFVDNNWQVEKWGIVVYSCHRNSKYNPLPKTLSRLRMSFLHSPFFKGCNVEFLVR